MDKSPIGQEVEEIIQQAVEHGMIFAGAKKTRACITRAVREAIRLRDEQKDREIERLRKAIRSALDHAAHRWSEWGSRAEEVEEILDAALGKEG